MKMIGAGVAVVVVIVIIIGAATGGGGDDGGSSSSGSGSRSSEPETVSTVEDCFSKWDGNLDALENLVRPLLNDRGSMETHETRFSRTARSGGWHDVRMTYSAKNALGGRVTTVATGQVHFPSCNVRLTDPGL